MESVTEKSSARLIVTFYNASNVAEAPSSALYKITDLDSEKEIVAPSSITPVATSVTLDITPTANTLVNQTKRFEVRVVTVTAVYGDADQLVEEYQYRVANSRA
jgi:hypothetical protein